MLRKLSQKAAKDAEEAAEAAGDDEEAAAEGGDKDAENDEEKKTELSWTLTTRKN